MIRFTRPVYNLRTFVQVWDNVDSFVTDFKESPYYNTSLGTIKDANIALTFYLLYNKYGNNPISNMDENQFKFKLFGKMAQYAPAWEQKLEIQAKLRSLGLNDDSEIYKGSKAIYNTALNPENLPKTGDLTELEYINSQNTTNYKKSKLEGLALLADSLRADVTGDYVNKFIKLFNPFVGNAPTYEYVSEYNEDDEDEEEY